MNLSTILTAIRKALDGLAPMLIGAAVLLGIYVVLYFSLPRGNGPVAPALWSDYAEAARESQVTSTAQLSPALYKIDDPTQPITVVTWMPNRYLPSYQASQPQNRDIWVTVAPFLKTKCQQFVKSNSPDPAELQLRLNQRLGMPPDAANDTFVELRILPSKVNLFRPCGGDPAVSGNNCSASLPPPVGVWSIPDGKGMASAGEKDTEWVLRNYYSNYSAASPYPWTALGYTFDWARNQQGKFERTGESEFILPAKSEYQFVSATDTATYCRP